MPGAVVCSAWKEKKTRDGSPQIAKNTKMVTIVKLSRTHKLTENVNSMRNVRTSDTKVNKAPNNMAIESWILERLTINSTKLIS